MNKLRRFALERFAKKNAKWLKKEIHKTNLSNGNLVIPTKLDSQVPYLVDAIRRHTGYTIILKSTEIDVPNKCRNVYLEWRRP